MPFSLSFSCVGLWNMSRAFLLCLLLSPTVVNAQPPSFSSAKWLNRAQRVDQDTALTVVHLKNEKFLQVTSECGELTGYFHDDKLRKIHCRIDYTPFRIDEKTFYFDQDRLFFVRHISWPFAFDVRSGDYRSDSLDAPFIGTYFFKGDKLLHYIVPKEGHHFESEEEDIEYSVSREWKDWQSLLRQSEK